MTDRRLRKRMPNEDQPRIARYVARLFEIYDDGPAFWDEVRRAVERRPRLLEAASCYLCCAYYAVAMSHLLDDDAPEINERQAALVLRKAAAAIHGRWTIPDDHRTRFEPRLADAQTRAMDEAVVLVNVIYRRPGLWNEAHAWVMACGVGAKAASFALACSYFALAFLIEPRDHYPLRHDWWQPKRGTMPSSDYEPYYLGMPGAAETLRHAASTMGEWWEEECFRQLDPNVGPTSPPPLLPPERKPGEQGPRVVEDLSRLEGRYPERFAILLLRSIERIWNGEEYRQSVYYAVSLHEPKLYGAAFHMACAYWCLVASGDQDPGELKLDKDDAAEVLFLAAGELAGWWRRERERLENATKEDADGN